MPVSTVTSKGQITIPKLIRERFGLTEGTKLEFLVDTDGRLLLRARRDDSADGVLGCLKDYAPEMPVSVDDMKRAVRSRARKKARDERS